MPLAMLFFGRPPPGLLGADAALTVITMAGLRLPDLKIEREYWSAEEALALPMLHTAHRLAVRRCYGGDMTPRKLVGLDEAHFMEGWRSGRSFLVRLARDSRKWNLAALVASQNPKDILGLDVQNLVSTVFVGRIAEDTEIAAEALRLLRVPVDDGYEATLASLSAGRHRPRRRGWASASSSCATSTAGCRRSASTSRTSRELLHYLDTTPGGVPSTAPSAARSWTSTTTTRRSTGAAPARVRAVVLVTAVATLFGGPVGSSAAAPGPRTGAGGSAVLDPRSGECRATSRAARIELQVVFRSRVSCLDATDAEHARLRHGRLVRQPARLRRQAADFGCRYSEYGYAGYDFTTYDLECASVVTQSDCRIRKHSRQRRVHDCHRRSSGHRTRCASEHGIRSYDVGMGRSAGREGHQGRLREGLHRFGAVTLRVVGLYLLWRSRQSDLSNAMTTAGWAIFVMVLDHRDRSMAKASRPASRTRRLITSLGVIHDAVGPPDQSIPPTSAYDPEPEACIDTRPPAVRASDTVVDGLLYRNWLRGDTRLGRQRHREEVRSRALRRQVVQLGRDRTDPRAENAHARREERSVKHQAHRINERKVLTEQKKQRWMQIAEQIKTEDPEAYEHLQGSKGMDRIGAGFLAILSALFFALFDITASVLVILGFLIFRWAVIAAPILGTVGLLRPANAGLRRLGNAVIAAMFNIIIFGTGSAIYLFAVTLILEYRLAGWMAAGAADLADRCRRLAVAATVSPDHATRRERLHQGDHLGWQLAPAVPARCAPGRRPEGCRRRGDERTAAARRRWSGPAAARVPGRRPIVGGCR